MVLSICAGHIFRQYKDLFCRLLLSDAELLKCANEHDIAENSWCEEVTKPATSQNLL